MTVISHSEYIADLSGSVAFTVNKYSMNPGLIETFPWLSAIAGNFESYLFKTLMFGYETTSPTTAPGSVMLGADFDAADPQPASKVEMMSNHNAVRSSPWAPVNYNCAKLDLAKFGVQRYTRSGSTGGDIKTYDVGNFYLATAGMADTSLIGELYVTYVVELYTPQQRVGYPTGLFPSGKLESAAPTVANAFASATVVGNAMYIDGSDPTKLVFRYGGSYLVTCFAQGTTASSIILVPSGSGVTVSGLRANSTDLSVSTQVLVVVVDAGASVTCPLTGWEAPTVFELRAAPYNSSND